MKIFKNNSAKIPKSNYNIVTIGSFDGVHLGHKKILQTIVEKARINKGKSIIVTFWPHPKMILNKKDNFKLLSTLEEKIKIFDEIKIDYLYIIDFSSNFSKTKADDFIKDTLLKKLKTNCLAIGYNHHFGYNREGNTTYLDKNKKRFNIDFESISKQEVDEISISSTKIREYLNLGKIKLVNKLLGRDFSISGTVVKGDGIGKKMQFPTANIMLDEPKKIVPKNGVYAVKIFFNKKKYLGMLNIGFRPTISEKNKTIEVNIFEFDSPIYRKKITINFVERLRDEKKFESLKKLRKQLINDKKKALSILNNTI